MTDFSRDAGNDEDDEPIVVFADTHKEWYTHDEDDEVSGEHKSEEHKSCAGRIRSSGNEGQKRGQNRAGWLL